MSGPVHFSKVLVANRGEIAIRVTRTARALGYLTVAVYSEADAGAPHVDAADEAALLGPAAAKESYLSIERVLDAARRTGADAIHPGYGFLSENAAFARACREARIVFVGPPAAAIELMGQKSAARRAMHRAGIPCVPGYDGDDQSEARLVAEAGTIGFPLMVKAVCGGGGRGLRLVTAAADLPEALRAARAEAASAFGSGELLLEAAIVEPRHVEVQVFADAHGGVVHLGERDCSVQRRHQKVIEESPSPAVDEALRARIGDAAVEAARACGYVGAGTVEFLLDPDRRFYFLEMNTRLQVEHPVTEMVTGFDLVEWQLRVAAGEPLPATQDDIALTGHAIEARLYAEDPAQGYLPQTGEVLGWRPPAGAGVRTDHAVAAGMTVSPHYDPMLAKVVAHGPTRDAARRRLRAALGDLMILGVGTNRAFLAAILDHPVFAAGEATTGFLSTHLAGDPTTAARPPEPLGFATAALLLYLEGARGLAEDESFIGWRSGGPIWSTIRIAAGGEERALRITAEGRDRSSQASGRRYAVTAENGEGDAAPILFEVAAAGPDELALVAGGVLRRIRFARAASDLWIDDGVSARVYTDVTHRPAAAAGGAASGRVAAPLDGRVIGVRVGAGDAVNSGQPLVILEAMKMEHRMVAGVNGVVVTVHVTEGDQVKTGQLLAEIEPAEAEA